MLGLFKKPGLTKKTKSNKTNWTGLFKKTWVFFNSVCMCESFFRPK